MNFRFRSAIRALITPLLAAVLGISPAYAQSGKPIRILVGFPAGGGTDAIARTLAEHLKDRARRPGDRREPAPAPAGSSPRRR